MDLSNIKIVFIDIDGTLVNDNGDITNKTKESIKRLVNKGIYVVITSGRNVIHTIDKSKKSNASGIVIASGGGLIYDYKEDKIIFEDAFAHEKVIDIWNFCNIERIGIILKSRSYVYYNNYSLDKNGIMYKLLDDIYKCDDFNISQFLLSSDSPEKIEQACEYVKSHGMFITSYSSSYRPSYVDKINSNKYDIDVNNSYVNKGTAISCLLKYLNIKKDDSLCFGDYINDLEMFNECGIRVAMGNAVEELKDKADFITNSNNDDGVAEFLDKNL